MGSSSSALRIRTIEFNDFRNYKHLKIADPGELCVFVGHNAVGKTNILEGIQLLTSASSFRHPTINQLVREGMPYGRISIDATDGNRQIDVMLSLETGKKRYTVNGKTKQAADVRGLLPSVVFTPDDLQLAKKSSAVKRDALDNLGMQLTRNYYMVRRDYEKTVRYKNRLLKDEAPRDLIESINETLITCGSQLYRLRLALFSRVIPQVIRVYDELAQAGELFVSRYRASWDRVEDKLCWMEPPVDTMSLAQVREIMAKSLELHGDEERRRGRSLIGPHNDEIAFTLAGRDTALFASQGQQRSVVLAWKLAEVNTIREVMGTTPVLLLDDVFSELDGNRREMLVRFVTADVQTFITATDLDGFSDELVRRARVVSLPIADDKDWNRE